MSFILVFRCFSSLPFYHSFKITRRKKTKPNQTKEEEVENEGKKRIECLLIRRRRRCCLLSLYSLDDFGAVFELVLRQHDFAV